MGEEYWERYRSAVDRQVEQAGLSESLESLPAAGTPLRGAGEPYRENWWLAGFLRRENVSSEVYLPTSLQLRKEKDRIDDTVAELGDEQQVRDAVSRLNERITAWLRSPQPPHIALTPVAVDPVVDRWGARRTAGADTPSAGPADASARSGPDPRRPRSWWGRLRHRG